MATANRPPHASPREKKSLFDPEGFPWLENGERMDQRTFHERYEQTPEGFKAELIGGVVYIMSSPLGIRHARSDSDLSGWLFNYRVATPGTMSQTNATTILTEESEPQPDSALLILQDYGGQTRDGEDEYTYGAPELIVEVAHSSRSVDLGRKLTDYERAGTREYLVYELKGKAVRWFALEDGRLAPMAADPDGLFRSRAFPGLWLDPKALASGDMATVLATLNRGLASPEHAAFVEQLRRRKEERDRERSELRQQPEG